MKIADVWQALIDAYPEFEIEFGPEPSSHWRRAIESLTPGELTRALDRLQRDPPTSRPNALQFTELARAPRKGRYNGPLTTSASRLAYFCPSAPASIESIDRHLRRIRATLEESQ